MSEAPEICEKGYKPGLLIVQSHFEIIDMAIHFLKDDIFFILQWMVNAVKLLK